jgi:hypothetical protein
MSSLGVGGGGLPSRGVTSGFYVAVTGQVDGCQMQGCDNLYVKYSFNKGHDWSVMAVRNTQRQRIVCLALPAEDWLQTSR